MSLDETSTTSPLPDVVVPPQNASAAEQLLSAVGLEQLASRVAILPSQPAHRLAASSMLLLLLVIIAASVLILALRRPVLSSRHGSHKNSEEWAPINVNQTPDLRPHASGSAAAGLPELQLPGYELPNNGARQYNTFGDDGDPAWQAAKSEWHAAISAAKRLSDPATGPHTANTVVLDCRTGCAASSGTYV